MGILKRIYVWGFRGHGGRHHCQNCSDFHAVFHEKLPNNNLFSRNQTNILPFQSRAEFWQQQKPMYARKGKSAKQGSKRSKGDPAKYILKCLEEIDEGMKILTILISKSVSLCYHLQSENLSLFLWAFTKVKFFSSILPMRLSVESKRRHNVILRRGIMTLYLFTETVTISPKGSPNLSIFSIRETIILF